jgi:ribosomal protein S18 acetylase RimI-like enzyme
VIVRRATAGDSHGIAVVHVSSWQHAYRGIVPQSHLDQLAVADREGRWAEILARGDSETLLAEAFGTIIGFISFGKSRQQDAVRDEGEVYSLYVSPSQWSTGVGRSLWETALGRLRELGFVRVIVRVLAANQKAILFYERIGFVPCSNAANAVEIGGARLREVSYEIAIR